MSRPLTQTEAALREEVVLAPHIRQEIDRSFELPTALLAGYFGLFLAYIGVMASAFSSPDLVIPYVVFAGFIVAAFAVPMAWVRMNPAKAKHALRLDELSRFGIMTETGKCSAGAASAQVLTLPILILCWGLAAAIIAAIA
ncbi:hypothetical protein [Sphingomicrobium nitratireducens]|uniref:hypothetical protein n=1 Tax=Sphingomicrobium nitratireducens TaxID=2964666 RepID=UPI00223ED9B1|nr:hypothetical protein [Sphingomicrobium nitratireducens]